MTKQADVCVVVGAGRREALHDGATVPLALGVQVLRVHPGGVETGSSTG